MSNRTPIAAVVWAPFERRTALFAKRLNAPVYNIHYLKYKRPLYAPFKYPVQALKTLRTLFRERPQVVYVTNPPVFAAMTVALYCLLTRSRYIMDTHPPALYSRKWSWTVPLQRWMARGALMNVTDQVRFKNLFESWGAKCVALENPPKDAPEYDQSIESDANCFEIAVVNTFAVDEPLDIILEAAKQLPDVRFSIMGDLEQADKAMVARAPSNAVFTGYLLNEQYWNCLARSRAVMVLTTYPYSLLGGAQDGIVMGKPLLLSRQPTLTDFFTKGTVFVENTTEGLVAGINDLRAREAELIREVGEFEVEQAAAWEESFKGLQALVQAHTSPTR